jgi:hypothetical protein
VSSLSDSPDVRYLEWTPYCHGDIWKAEATLETMIARGRTGA